VGSCCVGGVHVVFVVGGVRREVVHLTGDGVLAASRMFVSEWCAFEMVRVRKRELALSLVANRPSRQRCPFFRSPIA